ncbi:hypothetical protein CRYUN_Cryun10bG0150000 [Craigia yunnanensis]
MSEEEFGLPGNETITLPCEAFIMDYIILLISRGTAKDLEKALLVSISSSNCFSSHFHEEVNMQQSLVCSKLLAVREEHDKYNTCSTYVMLLSNNSRHPHLPNKFNKMISAKKLIKLAKKWQKLASIKQKKITLPRMSLDVDANDCSTTSIIEEGHFEVYSADQKRFMLPLEYLEKEIVRVIQSSRRRVWNTKKWTSNTAL